MAEVKAELMNVSQILGNTMLLFRCDGTIYAESLKDKPLRLEMKEWKEKRSLSANGLLWACINDMANVLRVPKEDLYLEMLRRYGQVEYLVVKEDAFESLRNVFKIVEKVSEVKVVGKRDSKAVQVKCWLGSHTYDSKEMSVLIDGVIGEMKELGLQPPIPEDVKAVLENEND